MINRKVVTEIADFISSIRSHSCDKQNLNMNE